MAGALTRCKTKGKRNFREGLQLGNEEINFLGFDERIHFTLCLQLQIKRKTQDDIHDEHLDYGAGKCRRAALRRVREWLSALGGPARRIGLFHSAHLEYLARRQLRGFGFAARQVDSPSPSRHSIGRPLERRHGRDTDLAGRTVGLDHELSARGMGLQEKYFDSLLGRKESIGHDRRHLHGAAGPRKDL